MRISLGVLALTAVVLGGQTTLAQTRTYRTLNDTFAPPHFTSLDAWNQRAAHIRELILESAGLMPMPERTPLGAQVFGEIKRDDYSVSKVYFESLPGFFATGNLYRPAGEGPFPAILSPHGHWAYGRLENSAIASVPGRAINLARQGFVVFTIDMVGYNDSWQLAHRLFGGPREKLWGLERRGIAVVERYPRARLSRVAALRASRRHRRDRRIGRRHAGLSPRGG